MCGIIGYSGKKDIANIIIEGLQSLEYRGYDSAGMALAGPYNLDIYKKSGKVSVLKEFYKKRVLEASSFTDKNSPEIGKNLSHNTGGDSSKKGISKNANNKLICSGIGHTRWATHGIASDINAHPHFSNSSNIAIVHNGIIENYNELKNFLLGEGYIFKSQTDTEIFVNFIEYNIRKIGDNEVDDIVFALKVALKKIKGQYAILLLFKNHPEILIGAKKNAPLVVGRTLVENKSNESMPEKGMFIKTKKGVQSQNYEYFVASDILPLAQYVNEVRFLNDNEIFLIKSNNIKIFSLDESVITDFKFYPIDIKKENISKNGYDSYMLKEIFEQPISIKKCIKDKIDNKSNLFCLKTLDPILQDIFSAERIIILSCGTSLNAAIYGKYIIEKYCNIPVSIEQASEFRYRNPLVRNKDLFIGISQSGETADTLKALEYVKENYNAKIISISNAKNSTITRLADVNLDICAGLEIGVASTKAFTNQLMTLIIFNFWLMQKTSTTGANLSVLPERISKVSDTIDIISFLNSFSSAISKVLANSDKIQKVALFISKFKSALFLGRDTLFPIALEGALKLKEISYIHAEGYSAAEMKHGPIALIDKNMPVITLIGNTKFLKKNLSSIEEISARNGKIITIGTVGNLEVKALSKYCIDIDFSDCFKPSMDGFITKASFTHNKEKQNSETYSSSFTEKFNENCTPGLGTIQDDFLIPITTTVVIQLLAYHTAIYKKCDVDKPRNLAKSVTVE